MPDIPAAPLTPTLEDLQHCGADELLANPIMATAYHEMWSRLFASAQAAAEDAPKSVALGFLAKICSMMLEPDDRAAAFKPMMATSTNRTTLPEDLTFAEIGRIADFVPTVQHSLLRARLADLVWLRERRRGVRFAHMAIEGYRQVPIDSDEWRYEVLKCRQRAIQLALSTGKGGNVLTSELAAELLGAFWKALDAGDQLAVLRYLRPLQNEGLAREEAGQIAEALEQLARRQFGTGDPFGSLTVAESAASGTGGLGWTSAGLRCISLRPKAGLPRGTRTARASLCITATPRRSTFTDSSRPGTAKS